MNDYIYDIEAEQYSFLSMPKILLQHEAHQGLSLDAKLLYSLFWIGWVFLFETAGEMSRGESISYLLSNRSKAA